MRAQAQLTRTLCGVRLYLSHTRTGFTGPVASSPLLSADPATKVHPPPPPVATQA
ncbi:hypothetical protein PIB30_093137, partial [Stylosanthes scabra]|nr:hypothetical protein [Stylosanthes scabra]